MDIKKTLYKNSANTLKRSANRKWPIGSEVFSNAR